IALIGHSEGGLVAAAAAGAVPARAVVMLAGPAVPVEVMLHDQARAISREAGASAAQLAHERGMNEAAFAAARGGAGTVEVAGIIADRLRTWPGAPLATPEEIAANAEVMAGIICAPAYRGTLRLEPGAILAAVEAPILAVYGGKDRQVAGHANRAAFVRATAANASAATMLFDDLNHLFQRAGTGSIGEYEGLAPGPEQAVLEAVSGWLERLPAAQLE
ncbi:MAG TPA: hypothetical protein VES64_04650, partial [Allosphingosinicella sp.]|nr:hypothetical protein [Allosphingosinicella sp.]